MRERGDGQEDSGDPGDETVDAERPDVADLQDHEVERERHARDTKGSRDVEAIDPSGRASRISHLIVAGLARRDRREQRAIGFEINQWRAVEAIEAAHQEAVGFDSH